MRIKRPVLNILWVIFFLPGLLAMISEYSSPSARYREYSEGEEELRFLIDRENAEYPDQFIALESRWASREEQWKADWHIFEPYLEISLKELEELSIPSTKKKMTPQYFWSQVYSKVAESNSDRVDNIGRAFLWFKERNDLSDRELLELVIRFIQEIPYEIPENDYGLYTPSEILYRNRGDCDSKSVFAAVLLDKLGYDTAIFYSSEYRHAMLGINVPSNGLYKEMDGKPYYFTEMTAKGWQIGDLPADCSDPDMWFISSL